MTEITREHLELAALAAGYDTTNPDFLRGLLSNWRPHLNDVDAMRLAVRLDMLVDVADRRVWASAGRDRAIGRADHDGTEPDKLRAWREAVVLCAAAVGERMRGER